CARPACARSGAPTACRIRATWCRSRRWWRGRCRPSRRRHDFRSHPFTIGVTVMRIAAGPCAALAFSLALSLVAVPARAADAVTDAMQAAYAPYRAALFRTNSKAQVESEQAIARAQAERNALVERFASRPPAPYDRDPAVAGALKAVADVYRKAETEIREKRL